MEGRYFRKCDKSVPSAKPANTTKSLTKLKKLVSALQKCNENGDDVSSTLTVEEEGSIHFQDALGRHNKHHPKIFLALKHRTCDREVDATFVVSCSEQALPNLLFEQQVYPSTAECGSILNLEGIPGCEDTPDNVQGIPGCEATTEDVRTREVTGCEVMPEDITS